jgi:plastocyanin
MGEVTRGSRLNERRCQKRRSQMKKFSAVLIALVAMTSFANAASVINRDADAQILMVTEGADKAELTVGPGETVEFCGGGCFVTMPNGDRQALTGSETVEISGGVAKIK